MRRRQSRWSRERTISRRCKKNLRNVIFTRMNQGFNRFDISDMCFLDAQAAATNSGPPAPPVWALRRSGDFFRPRLETPQKEVEDLKIWRCRNFWFWRDLLKSWKVWTIEIEKEASLRDVFQKWKVKMGTMTGLRAFLKDEMLSDVDVDLPVVESFDLGYSRMSLLFLFLSVIFSFWTLLRCVSLLSLTFSFLFRKGRWERWVFAYVVFLLVFLVTFLSVFFWFSCFLAPFLSISVASFLSLRNSDIFLNTTSFYCNTRSTGWWRKSCTSW